MMQDVSYVVERTKSLTDPSLPSPMEMLEELVKAKPTSRRAAQMSTAFNGLLRRKNDAASSSTASLNETPANATHVNGDNTDAGLEDDEDALVTNDVPAETQEPAVPQQMDGKLLTSEDTAVLQQGSDDMEAHLLPSNETAPPALRIESVSAEQESTNQESLQNEGKPDEKVSDEAKAENDPGDTSTQTISLSPDSLPQNRVDGSGLPVI